MKSFVIVGLLLVATFFEAKCQSVISITNDEMSEIPTKSFVELIVACAREMDATKIAEIPPLREDQQAPEDNPALNELYGCAWEKKGIINEEGVLSEDKLEDYVSEMEELVKGVKARAHNAVMQCRYIHGNDNGQTAIKITNCIYHYLTTRDEETVSLI